MAPRASVLFPGECYPDYSDRPLYSFLAKHYGWWNRYTQKGRLAPADVHPFQLQKAGTNKTNYHQRIPYQSKDMTNDLEECQILEGILSPITQFLDEQLSQLLPQEHSKLASLGETLPGAATPPAYPFTNFVVNICASTSAHKDSNDEGLCVVIPFGDYTGGELCLYEPGLTFPIQPGDILMFPSSKFTHFNLHFNGFRGSFVLHTDKKLGEWKVQRNHWNHIHRHEA
ncbi:hypothetical protein BDN72DRAFT_779467 [Pluteus cervinus]|uniref:Uncharacterized protein n=1 Tax=Pluteus cervinus TaxID=181527 RepID=A0ACD3A6E6_9AGAR|nr:hypothetical protein BDN72DRAFT_779467 [Pluteus cervinus]